MNAPEPSLSVRHNRDGHRYEIEVDGRLAHLDYERAGDRIVFTHTWVPPEDRERGLAAVLVRTALEDARRHGWQVVPQCPYVGRFIARNPEFADLVAG